MSQAVLELQEQGVLTKMKTRWWKEKRGGGACTASASSEGAAKLGLPNLGGVYVVLLGGSIFACVLGLIEWIWNVYDTARNNDVNIIL